MLIVLTKIITDIRFSTSTQNFGSLLIKFRRLRSISLMKSCEAERTFVGLSLLHYRKFIALLKKFMIRDDKDIEWQRGGK